MKELNEKKEYQIFPLLRDPTPLEQMNETLRVKFYQKKPTYLLLLLVFPVLAVIYSLLNNRPHNAVDFSTTIDHSIPFINLFIIPYILWYGYIYFYLVYFWLTDTKVYLKSLMLILVGELICFIIYYFFQTTVSRPMVEGTNLLNVLVQWIYSKDQPFNCFPSIHVLTTLVIMIGAKTIKYKHFIHTMMINIGGMLIVISTLFVKQHVVYDVLGSLFLAVSLNKVAKLLKESQAVKYTRLQLKEYLRGMIEWKN